ncbi:MAG: TM2 domain-containing protein [Bacteroidetes bacterium]|nr:TM2 domain-containing protein [Bacteroidota bacterium]
MFRICIFIHLLLSSICLNAHINRRSEISFLNTHDDVFQNINDYEFTQQIGIKSPNRLLLKIKRRIEKSGKITAAVMAFPVPFGIVGLHRIYLGTDPYVPVVYIATVGGCFGILPLIDFFVIVFEKDTGQYLNNPRVFMWAR